MGSVPSKKVALVVTRKPRDGLFDAFGGDVVAAFAADREVVMLALAVQMDREGQVLARA